MTSPQICRNICKRTLYFWQTDKRTFPKPPASHPFSPSYREWCRLPKTVGGTVTLPFPLVVEDPRSEPSALSSGFCLSGCPGPAGDSGSPLLISGVGEPCWGGSDGSGLVHKSCITPFPTGFKDASKRVYLQGHWGNIPLFPSRVNLTGFIVELLKNDSLTQEKTQ